MCKQVDCGEGDGVGDIGCLYGGMVVRSKVLGKSSIYVVGLWSRDPVMGMYGGIGE